MAKLISNEGFQVGIALNKNLLKLHTQKGDMYGGVTEKCYLRNGDQFEVFLKNQRSISVIVDMTVDGKNLGRLIMDPHQSVFLERFLTDNKRFIFNTYQVSEQLKEKLIEKAKVGQINISVYVAKSVYQQYFNHYSPLTFQYPS